jgi:hypothetical protein
MIPVYLGSFSLVRNIKRKIGPRAGADFTFLTILIQLFQDVSPDSRHQLLHGLVLYVI